MLSWDQTDATGIPAIDAQHQKLFHMVHELHGAYRTGKAREAIPDMLNALVAYCITHFAEEELHMKRMGFPDLAFHREQHKLMTARVHHLQDRYAHGEPDVAMELSILVSEWLKIHIKEYDQVFAQFIRCKPPITLGGD